MVVRPDPAGKVAADPLSKRQLQAQSSRTRKRRMRVHVFDACRRFSWQPRSVEIVDIRHVGIEDVEQLEYHTCPGRDAIADLSIPKRSAVRVDTGVLNEGARTKMTDAQAAEQRLCRLHRHTRGNDSIE